MAGFTSVPTVAVSSMTNKPEKSGPDAGRVLRRLAKDLDVDGTLADFPELSRKELSRIVADAAGPETKGRPSAKGPAAKRSASIPPGYSSTNPFPGTAVLSVDGGARGNPGPAGTGVVLEMGEDVVRLGEYIGEATNNVAEYRALLLGLETALDLGITGIKVRSDSQLMVRQLNGQYKVKNAALVELYFSAIKLLSGFKKSTLVHVPREQNKEADKMANLAIDKKGPVSL